MNPLFEDLRARGLIFQVTDEALAAELNRGPVTIYAGFDPTADSLHVGSFQQILTLKRFQMAGHRPIAVIGGATGMVGDPSFKATERSLLSREDLARNLAGIRKVIEKFLDFSGPNAAILVDNASWTASMSYLDFLRDIGKHFSVNMMIGKESVKERLTNRDQGISYTEFSYMLLQAFDFYVLNRDHNCQVQVGGSDQWGNITAGTELIRRMAAAEGKPAPHVYGLTTPLIMKADGTKFGKSEKGNVWLEARYTSPFQFYQFFLQTRDEDVSKLLRYLTFIPVAEIAELEQQVQSAPEKREAQKRLAAELTTLVHGEGELQKAIHASQAFFGTDIRSLDAQTLREVCADMPSATRPRQQLAEGLSLVEALASSGLCSSNGMAKKEIQGGGVYVNNERMSDPGRKLGAADLIADQFIVLRRGKKNYFLLGFE